LFFFNEILLCTIFNIQKEITYLKSKIAKIIIKIKLINGFVYGNRFIIKMIKEDIKSYNTTSLNNNIIFDKTIKTSFKIKRRNSER
jgi:glycerol-3-phosphate responsive antiterminator